MICVIFFHASITSLSNNIIHENLLKEIGMMFEYNTKISLLMYRYIVAFYILTKIISFHFVICDTTLMQISSNII